MAGLNVTRYRMQNVCGGVRVPSAGLMKLCRVAGVGGWKESGERMIGGPKLSRGAP